MVGWILKNIDILMMTAGLIIEFIGVYFISQSPFVLNIWKAFFSIDKWEEAPLILRIFAHISRIKNKEGLERELLKLSEAEAGKREFSYVYYTPFYGFVLIFLGLLLQIVANFFKIQC